MRPSENTFLTNHCNVCRPRAQVNQGLSKSFPKSEIYLVKDALCSKEGKKLVGTRKTTAETFTNMNNYIDISTYNKLQSEFNRKETNQ